MFLVGVPKYIKIRFNSITPKSQQNKKYFQLPSKVKSRTVKLVSPHGCPALIIKYIQLKKNGH